ncbi:pilus assembly protein PilP [Mameliella sediminis]|uniref:pilus assembly protein PilP n=1 Tax=Mameliella sediminis TaxID=2836866 RepID=UPI001C497AC3|nr:pilus assembly protein PilP [Mameliella sediminis]MBY6114668.1 pilus assembly protein PilP [Antarctobacter heliothermus]MBY6144241.1 pilus assembly protein PilP [Mameliella alba]MBV7392851.1 pilus assembly protein PilP [Mameliella sediminis]MBY6161467.1 pilus assembly protein PilP [Mameliella alba]MBY6170067.1 pilus assembly protein PilP [Mameliella alba]
MAQETATPQAVISAATTTSKGSLDGLILLGTFGTGETPRALVRTSRGKVVTLKPGDKIGRDPIVAIEDGRLALVQKGETRWLTQPVAN